MSKKGMRTGKDGVVLLAKQVLKIYLKDGQPNDIDYDILELMCGLIDMTVEDMIELQKKMWGDDYD